MEEPRIDFLQELLDQSEQAEAQQRIEMDKLRANQLLAAVAVIEAQMADVNDLVEREMKLLDEYRSNEWNRLEKKRAWLVFNLEGFMRSSGEKTLRLPKGVLKLRRGRDRAAVVDLDEFLKVGPNLGLVRSIPEQLTPDIPAIINHIRATGDVPRGVEYLTADTKFSYITTTTGDNDERE